MGANQNSGPGVTLGRICYISRPTFLLTNIMFRLILKQNCQEMVIILYAQEIHETYFYRIKHHPLCGVQEVTRWYDDRENCQEIKYHKKYTSPGSNDGVSSHRYDGTSNAAVYAGVSSRAWLVCQCTLASRGRLKSVASADTLSLTATNDSEFPWGAWSNQKK